MLIIVTLQDYLKNQSSGTLRTQTLSLCPYIASDTRTFHQKVYFTRRIVNDCVSFINAFNNPRHKLLCVGLGWGAWTMATKVLPWFPGSSCNLRYEKSIFVAINPHNGRNPLWDSSNNKDRTLHVVTDIDRVVNIYHTNAYGSRLGSYMTRTQGVRNIEVQLANYDSMMIQSYVITNFAKAITPLCI